MWKYLIQIRSPLPLLWEQQIRIHSTIGLVETCFWVHKTLMCRVSCRNGLAWFSVKCDQGTFPWMRNNVRTLWLKGMKTYQGVKRPYKPRTNKKQNMNSRIINVKMSDTDPSPLPLLWEQQIRIHSTIGLVETGFWVHKTIMCRVSCRNGLAWFSVKCDQGTIPWIRNNVRTLWSIRMETYQGVKRSYKPSTDRKTKCILFFYEIDSDKPPLVACTMVTYIYWF